MAWVHLLLGRAMFHTGLPGAFSWMLFLTEEPQRLAETPPSTAIKPVSYHGMHNMGGNVFSI